jgi:hypothetical protein
MNNSLLWKEWSYGIEFDDFLHEVTFTKEGMAILVSGGCQRVEIGSTTPYTQTIKYHSNNYESGAIRIYNKTIHYTVEKCTVIHICDCTGRRFVHNYRLKVSETPFEKDWYEDRRIFYADLNKNLGIIANKGLNELYEKLDKVARKFRWSYYDLVSTMLPEFRLYKYPNRFNEV